MALKTSRELTDESVVTIHKFQTGQLKPISVGIEHLNEALLGGLLPATILGIIGRTLNGKSYDMEKIQRHILENEEDVIFVNCNWELTHFKILTRDISFKSGKNIAEILFTPPSDESNKSLKEICDKHRRDNVFYQNEPVSPSIFEDDIDKVISDYPNHRIVVAIDNLENLLIEKGGQREAMDDLLKRINKLKNKHFFIAFIILNQMNDDYLKRMSNPKDQRPIDSDIFSTGQLIKLCDVLYVKMIPWRLGIRDKFMVFGKEMYPWLEEFKIYPTDKTASFDPFGTVYYFYLKQRSVADEKNIKDIFAERMFKREETDLPIESKKTFTPTFTPTFNKPEVEKPSPVIPNFSMNEAFDIPKEPF